jgi:uncharacterized linocin/CFP29 family protein
MDEAVSVDIVQGGAGSGAVVKRLLDCGFNANSLRPWQGRDGKTYITTFQNGKWVARPIVVNDATLRKDEWKLLDRAVMDAAKPRLRVVSDLRARGLTFNINGMGKTVLETQAMSDISDAELSMDGLRRTPGDRPVFDITYLPLPIVHKDFSFSAREIEVSRNGGSPLDTTVAGLASRKVAEYIEKMTLGTTGVTYTFGGGTIYGLLNYPSRITVTINDWTDSGTDGEDIVADVLSLMQASRDAYHYGPWVLYVAPDFGNVLAEDYKAASDKTIRQRLLEIEGLDDIRTSDYMTDSNVILTEMDPSTIRLIEGMALQTVQWPTDGGMRLNFKVMAITVPQPRKDYNDNTGLVHGSTS